MKNSIPTQSSSYILSYFIKKYLVLALLLNALLLSGCSEYWWSRGQAPTTNELIEKASITFNTSYEKRAKERELIAEPSVQIKDSLLKSVSSADGSFSPQSQLDIKNSLFETKAAFIDIEDNLSPTSRPAFGELAGQLRKFIKLTDSKSEDTGAATDEKAFELFVARTLFFLARELDSPSPVS